MAIAPVKRTLKVSYNQRNIKAWEKDLLALPAKIRHEEAEIQVALKVTERLKTQRDTLTRNSIAPLTAKRLELQSRLDALLVLQQMVHHNHHYSYEPMSHGYLTHHYAADSIEQSGDYATCNDIEDLIMALQKINVARDSLLSEQKKLDRQIAGKESEIRNQKNQVRQDSNRLQKMQDNAFLHKLQQNPRLLFDSLLAQSLEVLQKFETAHPAAQPTGTRLILAETLAKLTFFSDPPAKDSADMLQKYYQLCGMLWDKCKTADHAGVTEHGEDLIKLLSQHPIDPEEAKKAWQLLNDNHPAILRHITEEELLLMEKQQFDQACLMLSDTLAAIPDHSPRAWRQLRQRGEAVLSAIKAHQAICEIRHPADLDLKFFTRVLNKSSQLIKTPGDHPLQESYHSLVSHNLSGKSSLLMKIGGAMLALLGTATLVTSLALHLVTFGLAAPLTYAGLTAGGLLCASGVGLFAGGFQKGVAKKITQFEEASQTIYRGSYADFASEAVRSGQPEPSCPEFEENENLPPPYESNTEQDDLLAHCFKK